MKKFFVKLLLILLMLFVIIAITSTFLIIKKAIEPANETLIKDNETIKRIINEKYPSYEIKDIELNYTDWYSTVDIADENHKATKATVIIENENEQITVYLEKIFFRWIILIAIPVYGPNVPNDFYFVEMKYENVGKAIDINSYMKKSWVIPDEEGIYYKKVGNDENWYYSFKHCQNIYKTKDGMVYVFNKENLNWEVSSETYSDLYYYGNYEKVDKEYAMGIIEKYTSYKEH